MIPVLLILIPVITGLISFFINNEKTVKGWAFISSLLVLAISISAITTNNIANTLFDAAWLPSLGARFAVGLDGMSKMLVLLTSISFTLVFYATNKNQYKNTAAFYGLMLLTQAGLMGVFLATDCLLFYFFWEFALIPVYFLCSIWGGEKRIAVTFKFFIYTFIGSLFMLVGILYLYFLTPDQSFSLNSFYSLKLTLTQQCNAFLLFFIAFAIKMPIFPLHTWQPDAYEQSPTATTMILSGVMVKMGLFGVIKWLLPIVPLAIARYATPVMILSVIGIIYASLIAIKQDDVKKLIAYSSIAHIGLMCAAIFAQKNIALEGVLTQMFNHGINVIGLWIIANAIEQQLGTRKLSELGGLAQMAPKLAILTVVMSFANVALPLTNAFIGEFLMFNGIFQYNFWLAAVAGISIILAAVYTLNMVQKVFYGNIVTTTQNAVDIDDDVFISLSVITVLIIALGVFPQPLINLTKSTVQFLFVK